MNPMIEAAIAAGEETTGLCTVREVVKVMQTMKSDQFEMFFTDNGKKFNVEIHITKVE